MTTWYKTAEASGVISKDLLVCYNLGCLYDTTISLGDARVVPAESGDKFYSLEVRTVDGEVVTTPAELLSDEKYLEKLNEAIDLSHGVNMYLIDKSNVFTVIPVRNVTRVSYVLVVEID